AQRQVDLEAVSGRLHLVQADRPQRGGTVGAESRGRVADAEAEHDPGVDVGRAGQRLTGLRPVDYLAAVYPPGSDGQVCAVQRGDQAGQVLGLVRAVRVHLDDHVVTALERPAEPRDVGLAQARLVGPVHDLYVRIGLGQLVGQVPGPVRAVVVHDQQVRRRQRRSYPARDGLQVLPLVV